MYQTKLSGQARISCRPSSPLDRLFRGVGPSSSGMTLSYLLETPLPSPLCYVSYEASPYLQTWTGLFLWILFLLRATDALPFRWILKSRPGSISIAWQALAMTYRRAFISAKD